MTEPFSSPNYVPQPLETDGQEYEILAEAVMDVVKVPGMICEIGTRRGGSARIMIQSLIATGQLGRTFICIDPYGNIDYQMTSTWNQKFDYTNDMKKDAQRYLYEYVQGLDINFLMFIMEDTEFFKRFADGVPVYNEHKMILDKYAAVYLDGPHGEWNVRQEIEFFIPRMSVGGVMVFDDITHYSHEFIETQLFSFGFELLRRGKYKASYVKAE